MYWNIGNGCQTKIWIDKWVSRPTSYKVQASMHKLHREVYVRELINSPSVSWNKNLISQIFNQEEASLIHNFPISQFGLNDKIIQKLTKNGQFTVRFAYHLKMSLLRDKSGVGLQENNDVFYWSSIWNMNILRLVKQFIWRACNNLLPTKVNLAIRKVVEDLCPLCGKAETILHAIWECPISSDVWGEGDSPLRKWSLNTQNFWSFWTQLVDNTYQNTRELCSITCKNIWIRRNNFLFEGSFDFPSFCFNKLNLS